MKGYSLMIFIATFMLLCFCFLVLFSDYLKFSEELELLTPRTVELYTSSYQDDFYDFS